MSEQRYDQKYMEIKPEQLENSKEVAQKISAILDDEKALQLKIIETNKQTIIADYFVIATGTSSTHIRSLADEVDMRMNEEAGRTPSRISGQGSRDWIIMDYDSVLVHIFNREARDYYKLERLWGDGRSIISADIKLDVGADTDIDDRDLEDLAKLDEETDLD